MLPAAGFAQYTEASTTFREEELEQMLAPVALYPDTLLIQILMGATYPLEIVAAARWVQDNPDIKGDELAAALEQKDWDPSVKSLVNFPSVLAVMNDKIEWTQKLGDAFLAREEQVMDTVQKLRQKAYAQGNLNDSNEQKVIVREKVIVIEPAGPEVIYVPYYDPFVVFGPWWYPAFPPFFFHPHSFFIGHRVIFFSSPIFIGAPWGFAFGIFDWPHRHVFINVHKHVTVNRFIDRNRFIREFRLGHDGTGRWQHDARHRRGVIYRERTTRERFRQVERPGAEERRDFRGRFPDVRTRSPLLDDRGVTRPGDDSGRGRPDRDRERPAGESIRQTPQREVVRPGRRPDAFEGIERGGDDARISGDRGRRSRETRSAPAVGRDGDGRRDDGDRRRGRGSGDGGSGDGRRR